MCIKVRPDRSQSRVVKLTEVSQDLGLWVFCFRSVANLVHEVIVMVKRQDELVTIISFSKFAYKDNDCISF